MGAKLAFIAVCASSFDAKQTWIALHKSAVEALLLMDYIAFL